MCGIAGIYHLDTAKPVDPARLRAMLQPMQHRGPDGSGEWTAPGVGLAHLRLSIIDIAGSPQPMASDDEAVTLTYNGEIYNFRELRAELEDRGHRFRTSGDTEVIIAARSEEHTSELQSLMRISYAVFCLKKKQTQSNRN